MREIRASCTVLAAWVTAVAPPGTLISRTARPLRRARGLSRLLLLVAAVLAAFARPAGAQKPLGVDVSGWVAITPAQWVDIRNAGYIFSFARASYGWGGTDSKFAQHMTNAKAAGLYTGAYHFSYPMYSSGNTAVNEANTFLNMARNYIGPGYLPPVLDLEWNGAGLTRAQLSQWANEWMNYVQQQTGVEPMIYCNTNYAQNYVDSSLANRMLWIANWPTNPNPQTGNPGIGIFNTWTFWQYEGDVTSVDGLTLDHNVFHGSLAQLQALVGGPSSIITCSPMILGPTVRQGRNTPNASFTIANTGTGTLNYFIALEEPWLSVSPANGTSTGETDTIMVTYANAPLRTGTYTAAIQITAQNAANSPQTVTVTLTIQPVPGDVNADGSIDQSDVGILRACMTGAGVGQTDPTCQVADIDHDGDVDQSDFGALQRCLSGTGIHPDPDCAP